MKKRVRIIYPDGTITHGYIDTSGDTTTIEIGGAQYDISALAATNATVAVNDQEALELLQSAGINARPTARQPSITFMVSGPLKERLIHAAEARGRNLTSVLLEACEEWLAKNGE